MIVTRMLSLHDFCSSGELLSNIFIVLSMWSDSEPIKFSWLLTLQNKFLCTELLRTVLASKHILDE